MEDSSRRGRHDSNLASRKAEEAAWRRFQATQWLESLVGPLGISTQPSEREFISCLRNGLVLCNAINKIKPGSIPKVVDNHSTSQSLMWDSQPLPAYQYFENVRNFLVAVEDLKLPAFEASDLERDDLDGGSTAKVVDCILGLKAYHEWKKISGANGSFKPPRSPLIMSSASRIHSRASGAISSDPCRRLEMSAACDKHTTSESESRKLEDSIIKALADCMVDAKENIDDNLLASFHNRDLNTVSFFSRIMTSCLEEQVQNKVPELNTILKDLMREGSSLLACSTSTPLEDLSPIGNHKCCRACLRKGSCNHWHMFQTQEKELSNLKALLSRTKEEFEDLQNQLQSDLKQLGSQVEEMSSAALGYHKVVKENRNLYNMVQDLKGNIRVYCRIRPAFSTEARNVIDFIGEDGSLVVLDPSNPQKDGRKVFQFNRVFGLTTTQDEVFRDTQPLIRSVMDGYNVCIFAYGQTGSGKTHTMSGPSGGSTKDMGINYLALSYLFELSNKRKEIIKYDIYVQVVEIYNEQVRDLLAEDPATTKLEIRSCTSDDGLNLPDATVHCVNSTTDVLSLMKRGELNRAVSSTAINNRSSRSHSVLTVHVHGKDVSGSIIQSCLHLVDLAGSERVDKSEVTGDVLKEALYINKSLSCLGDVITALAQKSSYIPYRNSKLTLLLQNSLGGHAKTLMLAHVSPEGDSLGETISTLKFAQRVSTVELGAARMNKESQEVMELKEQIENLKKALANKEARLPFEKPKATAERTPPRPRRLSIESCSSAKMEKPMVFEDNKETKRNKPKEARSPFEKPKTTSERTPPRPRRLSIENCSAKKIEKPVNIEDSKETRSLQRNKPKEVKSPCEKPKTNVERTPPPSRRLSIENCSATKMEKPKNFEDNKEGKPNKPKEARSPFKKPTENSERTPRSPFEKPKENSERTPPRSRRLSIENRSAVKIEKPRNFEDNKEPKTPHVPTRSRRLSLEGSTNGMHIKVSETVLKQSGHNNNGDSAVDGFRQRAAPRSPISSSAFQSRTVKLDSTTKIQPLQLPKTPEPQVPVRSEVQVLMQSEPRTTDSRKQPNLTSSTNSKAYQIRKSLRTIGKLINGSEKRNQQKQTEVKSPVRGTSVISDAKSPIPASARALRRQSLIGIQTSRRSSLGGNSNDPCIDEARNAKTPPPVHGSAKLMKRWL